MTTQTGCPAAARGGLHVGDVVETAGAIASVQRADGCIPWSAGAHADPWNHVEAAMALTVGGRLPDAERAYRWLARTQRRDGTWAASYRGGAVEDAYADANFCAYVAAGLWHHRTATREIGLCVEMWPVVQRAMDAVLSLQSPGGEVWWARDPAGCAYPMALLASSSSILFSLRCAQRMAAELGRPVPRWADAADRLAGAIREGEERFEERRRWAMDWYYPVLGGALTGAAARARLAARWDEFVVDGLGVRCVADRPWVTSAETCELVLALDAVGLVDEARRLFDGIQLCRTGGGAYWEGWEYDAGAFWPDERPTWSSAAVVLAADALHGLTPAAGFFRTTR